MRAIRDFGFGIPENLEQFGFSTSSVTLIR